MQIGLEFHVCLITTAYANLCELSKHRVVDVLQVDIFD